MDEDQFVKKMQDKIPHAEEKEKNVIIRSIMSKTVLRIYPNGQVYLDKQNSISWVMEQKEIFKRKEKPKLKAKPTTKLQAVEEW